MSDLDTLFDNRKALTDRMLFTSRRRIPKGALAASKKAQGERIRELVADGCTVKTGKTGVTVFRLGNA